MYRNFQERMEDCRQREREVFNEELEKVGGDNCRKAEARAQERLRHEHF